MRYRKVPDETIRRLPGYLNGLLFLAKQGHENLSSHNLAEFLGVNPSQIRKDFSYFGGFGIRGRGYEIQNLIKQIGKILKLDTARPVALVGVGNLGSALLAYPGFAIYGFDLVAAFDSDPQKIGKTKSNITIEGIAGLDSVREKNIKIAIIAVPRPAAQQIADTLVQAGVTGILNFAPCYLKVPKKVKVVTINIATDLARLPYYMPQA